MENGPKEQSQEGVTKMNTPESGVNKYFQQGGKQETLSKEEIRGKITDAENRIATDIAGLDAIRSKLGLPPATDEDIKNLPAFAQNLANLKELRAIEKQNVESHNEEAVVKQDISTNEQVQTDEDSAYEVFRGKLGIPSTDKEESSILASEKSLLDSVQEVDTNTVNQLQNETPAENESVPENVEQDKAPFLRDAIDLINERSERINNEVNPTQDINTVQEILQPQATESISENVPEIKTEEVVVDQISKEQVVTPENVEPASTLDQIEEVEEKNTVEEDILAPQTEQSINNTEQKEGSIESMEAEAIYVESIKNFTNSYKGFFENLLRYNESTLQKNGEESTDSILYGGDIDAITKDLDDVMSKINNTATAKTAMEHMVNINAFLMENLFPVKSGMSSASVEGYDFLGKSIDEIGASLVSFYGTLKASKQEGSVQEVATQLSESLGQLKDLQERKLGHLNDYLSR